MRQRFFFLFCAFLLWFGAVIARLYYWQGIKAADLKEAARNQYERASVTKTFRGEISFADGHPLAMNVERFTLIGKPNVLKETPLMVSAALMPIIFSPSTQAATDATKQKLEQVELQNLLITRMSDPKRKWVPLVSSLTQKQKEDIEKLNISALTFEAGEARYYPEGSMSAHLLGFLGKDANGEAKGYFGLEGYYDLELKGKTSRTVQISDAVGQPISIDLQEKSETGSSRSLHLSIERDIQHTVEKHLEEGAAKYGAKSADVIIMDPLTGKVLAMASYPSYDPANYSSYEQALFKNPSVADGYEPGSTFKVLTVASGIDAGVISPDTQCDSCAGPVNIGKYTIKTWNNEYHPNTTILDGLKNSDNTAMVYVAQKIGKERFVSYVKKFGIGEQTGIDLQEESTPKLRADTDWGEIDVATASFGQGIALTMVQMLNGVNVIANGGVLMKPYVVAEVKSDDASFVTKPTEIRRVIKSETAKTVARMMQQAASSGDARWTLPKQYSIAGKTGTAQIPVAGHYDENRTIASFVGFAPVENPRFSMLVRVVEPTSSPWGSETAAPLWFAIAKDLFVKFGIPQLPQNQ